MNPRRRIILCLVQPVSRVRTQTVQTGFPPRSRAPDVRKDGARDFSMEDGMEEMHDDDTDSDEMKPKIYKTVWSPEVRPRSRDPGPNNSS